ncbi:hypothetical protein POL68_02020 [Stigmatella sp. ncwal1]|uniref:Uncharacterized protein n=1 Tax=Stigmatella ashevillensis TaxID=2995309 RepID=A0ABT5D4Q6_9BACT|nr:hypothetical protein [Stigmatella ashevillena]MDC0707236.1 hypothetical protein [Stigmatella ashevillena]
MDLLPRIVLCTLLALPTLGRAQTGDAPVASPEPSPPPLVTSPPDTQAPPSVGEIIPRDLEDERPRRPYLIVPRILLSSLAGTVAGAGGTFLGFLVGSGINDCDLFDDVCGDKTLYAYGIPTLIAAGSLSSLAVYGVGSLLDGRGSFLPTLLGGFVGAGASIAFQDLAGYGVILLIAPLSAVGAILGYEISGALWEPAPLPQQARSSLQVLPVLGLTPDGGVLGGLTGRF